MKQQLNHIGINKGVSKELSEKLNTLLANYSVFYMNARGFHWNIKGDKFFELHNKFEELYNDSREKIDEIAERVLTLGFAPKHSYSDYLLESKVLEAKNVSSGLVAIRKILQSYQIILPLEREILELASNNYDEGTSALMSDYIREQEKQIWMYSAYIAEE